MIDEPTAIAIARQRAIEKGWAFPDPVSVIKRYSWSGSVNRFEIETNAGNRGTKSRFVIRADDGIILEEGYLPR